ncbi:MAG: PulJ/GspJ family protein [Pseudobdellovibrionaceae bacterium]
MSRLSRNEGQSLISVMIGMGVMVIMALAFMSMMSTQQKEARAIAEKLASLDLERVIIASFADGSICTAELSDSTLNPSAPYTINTSLLSGYSIHLNAIHAAATPSSPVLVSAGSPVSPLINSLKVSGINFKNFTVASGNKYLAELEISFDQTNLVRSIKPVVAKVIIGTDASQKINSCMNGGPGASTGVTTIYQCPNVPGVAALGNHNNGYIGVVIDQTGPLISHTTSCYGGSTQVRAQTNPCSGQLSAQDNCQTVGAANNVLANTVTYAYCAIACTAVGKLTN